jgi:hypothetical protein
MLCPFRLACFVFELVKTVYEGNKVYPANDYQSCTYLLNFGTPIDTPTSAKIAGGFAFTYVITTKPVAEFQRICGFSLAPCNNDSELHLLFSHFWRVC